MEFTADFSAVPEALCVEIPQEPTRAQWFVRIVATVLAALYLPVIAFVIWTWLRILIRTGGMETVVWIIMLFFFALLTAFQCGFPYFLLWSTLPRGFGVQRVTIRDGVLEARLGYRRIRHPAQRIVLREHSDLQVTVNEAKRDRWEVLVRGRRAVPVLVSGRMTRDEADRVAEGITTCIVSSDAQAQAGGTSWRVAPV